MKNRRLKKYKRNNNLEELLNEINGLLAPIEREIISKYKDLKYPVVLIMGAARSGTTIILQWLAETGNFAYPTNMLSRFYEAPYIGAKIQLMLTKYDHNNEISNSFSKKELYRSDLGKTKGALSPHEFWYFWRRFFNFGGIHKLEKEELDKIDTKSFVSEIAALEEVFNKPFVMKGMIVNWHIPFIEKIMDKVLFVHVKRKPVFQIQSVLKARKKYYGNINHWYSFKPPEYNFLKKMNPYIQVAGQIYYTNKAIEDGFKKIAEKKCLSVNYEDFCNSPEKVYNDIKEKLLLQGFELQNDYKGPEKFISTNKLNVNNEELNKIKEGYQYITGERVI